MLQCRNQHETSLKANRESCPGLHGIFCVWKSVRIHNETVNNKTVLKEKQTGNTLKTNRTPCGPVGTHFANRMLLKTMQLAKVNCVFFFVFSYARNCKLNHFGYEASRAYEMTKNNQHMSRRKIQQ